MSNPKTQISSKLESSTESPFWKELGRIENTAKGFGQNLIVFDGNNLTDEDYANHIILDDSYEDDVGDTFKKKSKGFSNRIWLQVSDDCDLEGIELSNSDKEKDTIPTWIGQQVIPLLSQRQKQDSRKRLVAWLYDRTLQLEKIKIGG